MTTWYYFKEMKSVPIEKQVKIATEKVPDRNFWLGQFYDAYQKDCKDPIKLLFTRNDEVNRRSSKTRPIKRGDELWIYNLYTLGTQLSKIQESIMLFHKANVALHIYTIDYYDDCNVKEPLRRDYKYTFTLISEILERSQHRYQQKQLPAPDSGKKNGRPPKMVSFNTLTEHGQNIIKKYCTDPNVSRDDAFEDMQNPGCYKSKQIGSIGLKKFHALVREYDELMRKDPTCMDIPFRSRSR